MAEIHYKVTTWRKMKIDDSMISKERLIEEITKDFDGFCNSCGTINDRETSYEDVIIDETEEYLNPEENDDQPTIEVYADDDTETPIWTNTPIKQL